MSPDEVGYGMRECGDIVCCVCLIVHCRQKARKKKLASGGDQVWGGEVLLGVFQPRSLPLLHRMPTFILSMRASERASEPGLGERAKTRLRERKEGKHLI